jgi:hypothetical protein
MEAWPNQTALRLHGSWWLSFRYTYALYPHDIPTRCIYTLYTIPTRYTHTDHTLPLKFTAMGALASQGPMASGCYLATPPLFTANMALESTHLVGGGNDASTAGWCVSVHANAVASSCRRPRSSKRNPITCSGPPSARVLLVRAHLLVAYYN